MDTDNNNKGLSIVKIIATILFVSLPLLGFYIGINYEKSIVSSDINEVNELPLKNINKNNQTTITQTIPSPNIDETISWKTYTNKEYKYSFKYPSNWYTTAQQDNVYVYINNLPIPSIPLTHGLSTGIQIGIDFSQEMPNPPWKHSKSTVILGGISGTKIIDEEPNRSDDLLRTTIVLSKNNVNYWIIFVNSDNKGTHNLIFDQILSTFKFTN